MKAITIDLKKSKDDHLQTDLIDIVSRKPCDPEPDETDGVQLTVGLYLWIFATGFICALAIMNLYICYKL